MVALGESDKEAREPDGMLALTVLGMRPVRIYPQALSIDQPE
jgi:hypothetical protein